jgi:hypothetical protein
MSVSYGGDKITFEDGSTVGSGWAGFKNRIINGAMVIDQRNAGASVAPTDAYTLDRWELREDTDGAITCQQVADAPIGFVNSSKITTTTADASLSGTQRLFFRQPIEGYNIADLAWGTASASPVTLSFWVKSSLTGTFGGSLANSGTVRSYPFTYTINASNTWEYKTLTIAGDTTGTWLTTNGAGINLFFGLGVGSDYSGTAGAWTTAARFSATGTTSVIGTLGATWQVTGVQLEKGSTASSFEYRPYGTELALCQRYYVDLANNGGSTQNTYRAIGYASTYTTTQGTYVIQVPVPMRTVPSLTQAGTMYLQNLGTTSVSSFAGPYSMAGTIIEGDFTMVGTVTANITAILRWNNSSTQKFAYSAEF